MWGFPNPATCFTMILTNVQFIGLLTNIDIPWPPEWTFYFSFFNIFNLDPVDLIGESEVAVIDYRTLFMIVAILVPIALNIAILLLYKEISRIVWYVTLIFGMVILIAGALGRLLPSAGLSGNEEGSNLYMFIGGSCVFVALSAALAVTCYRRYNPEDDNITAIQKIHVENLKFHRQRSFLQFGVSMLCLMIGVVLMGVVNLHITALTNATATVGTFVVAIGWFFFIMGCCMFLVFLLNLCKAGRIVTDAAQTFVKANLLMLLLIAVNSSYIPVQQYSMNMYMCVAYTCPAGFVFNPYASRPTTSYDHSSQRFCDPCTFLNPSCGAGNVSALCPGWTGYRNWQNPEVPCDDESITYFYIAAGICLVAYTLAIPYMYKKIIETIVVDLQTSVVIDPSMDAEMHWERQTLACRPAAASLYEPFFLHKRYYIIMWLLQRLLVVATLVIIAPFSDSAAAVILGLHGIVCIMAVVNYPIMNHYEMALYQSLCVCNMTNGIYSTWVWLADGDVAPAATGFFVFINIALPIVVLIIMKIIHVKKREQWDEEDAEATKIRKADYKKKKAEEEAAKREEEGDDVADSEEGSEAWDEEFSGSDGWSDGSYESNASSVSNSRHQSRTNSPSNSPANSQSSTPRAGGRHRSSTMSGSRRSRSSTMQGKKDDSHHEKRTIQINMADEDDDNEPVNTKKPESAGEAAFQKAKQEVVDGDKRAKKKKLKKLRARAIGKLKESLNKATGDMLSNFFMILGAFFFVALGAAVLGTLRQTASPFVIGHNSLNRGVDSTLASYPSWSMLTSECCCATSSNPSTNFNTTERWVCKNGRVLDKGRISKRLTNNATDFRGICAEVPNPDLSSCRIEVVDGAARLFCSEVDRERYPDVTGTAYNYYW